MTPSHDGPGIIWYDSKATETCPVNRDFLPEFCKEIPMEMHRERYFENSSMPDFSSLVFPDTCRKDMCENKGDAHCDDNHNKTLSILDIKQTERIIAGYGGETRTITPQ